MLVPKQRMWSLLLFGLNCWGLVVPQPQQPYVIPSTTDCKLTKSGHEYVGPLSVTQSGWTCQRWDSDQPHSHPYKESSLYPDRNISAAGNKCRNPDSNDNAGTWCYTTRPSIRWDRCNVAFCECKLSSDMLGIRYQGRNSITRSGKRCQSWSLQWPTRHPFTQRIFFPDDSVANAGNYCRNPNASRPDGPWCYATGGSAVWEYCRINVCNYTLPVLSTRAPVPKQTSSSQTLSSTQRITSSSTTVPRTTALFTTGFKIISSSSTQRITSSSSIAQRTTRLSNTIFQTMSSRSTQRTPSSSITVPRTTPLSNTGFKTISSRSTQRSISSSTTVPRSMSRSNTDLRTISSRSIVVETLTTFTMSSKTRPPTTTRLQSTISTQSTTSLRNTPEIITSSAAISSMTKPPFTKSSQSSTSLRTTSPITVVPITAPPSTMSSESTHAYTTSTSLNSSIRIGTMSPITTRSAPSTAKVPETIVPSTTSSPFTTNSLATTSPEAMHSANTGPEPIQQRTSTRVQSSTDHFIKGDDSTAQGTQRLGEESFRTIKIAIPIIIIGVIAVVGIIVIIVLWKRSKLFQSCCRRNGDLPNAPDKKTSQESGCAATAAAANTDTINNYHGGLHDSEHTKDGQSTETKDLTKDSTDGINLTDSDATYIPMNSFKPSSVMVT